MLLIVFGKLQQRQRIHWNSTQLINSWLLYYECASTGKLPVASNQAVVAMGSARCQVLLLVKPCAVLGVEIAFHTLFFSLLFEVYNEQGAECCLYQFSMFQSRVFNMLMGSSPSDYGFL